MYGIFTYISFNFLGIHVAIHIQYMDAMENVYVNTSEWDAQMPGNIHPSKPCMAGPRVESPFQLGSKTYKHLHIYCKYLSIFLACKRQKQ